MQFLRANKLFNGEQFLPQNAVLVLENNGILKDIILDTETDVLNIKTLEGIITPGFVNVHCHLELSHLKSLIPTHTGLVEFAKQIIINRNRISKDEALEYQVQANKAMWSEGIVAVGDICNTNESLVTKQSSNIYYHSFIELLGLNPANATTNFDKGLLVLNEFKNTGLAVSFAPHAPYSTSNKLMDKIIDYNLKHINCSTIHNQESEEETKFFMGEKNDFENLYQFLNLDISWFKAPKTSSLHYYYSHLKNQNTILVHNTGTKKQDIEFTNNQTTSWCFCPNANLYIENKLPQFELFKNLQNSICLGTDSLASNWDLNLISEANVILKNTSTFSLENVLKFMTFNGAKALSISNKFGSFIIGKNAGLNLISTNNNQLTFTKKII